MEGIAYPTFRALPNVSEGIRSTMKVGALPRGVREGLVLFDLLWALRTIKAHNEACL